jgi:hypothetical protein
MLNLTREQKINILYKIILFKNIEISIKKLNLKKGAKLYSLEYIKKNLNKYVKIKDVQEYCNQRTKQETGHPLGDPSRSFEILRKENLPLDWNEIIYKKIKYVKYNPLKKIKICSGIINSQDNKFTKFIVQQKLKICNYKCSITGIPQKNGDLSADHFIPKEKGGKNNIENCIIINKILNEKKNKKMPIEWFCETLLFNFMNICKNVGILNECKIKLIKFIEDFT